MKQQPNSQTRIPWSAEEDADIEEVYRQANGAFPTYKSQAAQLNSKFHQGKPVRSPSAVRRREGRLLKPQPL